MKNRYLYSILFGIPGIVIAFIVSTMFLGAFAGLLWLFVFGDDSWPEYSQTLMAVVFCITYVFVLAIIVATGYRVGRRNEQLPTHHLRHILISGAATVILIIIILLHQLGVGNIGPESVSQRCGNYCSERGYQGSGMPPRDSGEMVCMCYGQDGREVVRVLLGDIRR